MSKTWVYAALAARMITVEPTIVGTRCSMCGTYAPDAFSANCNRPECQYRRGEHRKDRG